MKIILDKTMIKKIGDNLISNAEDLRIEKARVDLTLDRLSSAWEGTDSIACYDKAKDVYLPNLEKLSNRIESYGEYLKQIPSVYDEVDSVFARKKLKNRR